MGKFTALKLSAGQGPADVEVLGSFDTFEEGKSFIQDITNNEVPEEEQLFSDGFNSQIQNAVMTWGFDTPNGEKIYALVKSQSGSPSRVSSTNSGGLYSDPGHGVRCRGTHGEFVHCSPRLEQERVEEETAEGHPPRRSFSRSPSGASFSRSPSGSSFSRSPSGASSSRSGEEDEVELSEVAGHGVRCRVNGGFAKCPPDLEQKRIQMEKEEGHSPRSSSYSNSRRGSSRSGGLYEVAGRGERCRGSHGEFVHCPPNLEEERIQMEEEQGHSPRSR